MDTVVRMAVEPFFNAVIKKIEDLDKKIITLDTKITKIEKELVVLGCKLDTRLPEPDSSRGRMENVD